MGLDASAMSVSPAVNRLNPAPVPPNPTLILTLGCSLRNSSATATVIGKTVLEPSISIVPLNLPVDEPSEPWFAVSPSPHADGSSARQSNISMPLSPCHGIILTFKRVSLLLRAVHRREFRQLAPQCG